MRSKGKGDSFRLPVAQTDKADRLLIHLKVSCHFSLLSETSADSFTWCHVYRTVP